jgi:hypothetical protein
MADKKISALTGASTPLAGTEVLPIVQSGSTVKVSVANLTAGRTTAMSLLDVENSAGGGVLGTFKSNWSNTKVAVEGDGATGAGVLNISNVAASAALPFKVKLNGTEVIDVDTSGNAKATIGNFVIGTAGKGIVDSTGTTSLQFTSLQVASNKQIVAPSVVTATGNTASTPTATPVTLFTPSGDGVWIVNALVTLTGAPAAYITSSMIKASGGVLAATAISTATNMSISVSGANVQATQTSGGNQVIAFSYIRLF